MEPADLALRRLTYALFVELGRAPGVERVAERSGLGPADVLAGWRRLHDAHALVLDAAGAELRMANPFSAVPTPHHVTAGGREWFANCAWDAFGVCAALGVDGRVSTACADCGDALTVDVRGRRAHGGDGLLFHCLVPAALWWDDIGFT